MKPGAGQQQAQEAPRAYKGDHVYFHKGGEPVSGEVMCTGKHGCTVSHKGEHHKVKWQHVLGHKKRAPQRYHVEEEGEDGLIVRDGNGKRHYVGIPPEARPERLELDKPAKTKPK